MLRRFSARLIPWTSKSSSGVCPNQKLRVRAATGRSYATVSSQDSFAKPGDHVHGFTLQRQKHVPELQLTALHLQHEKTGAEYLHVARDDKNNVFSVGFKTNPPDATGVPHILEHTTLCGSERYPVRDPFFKMLRRSLSNFMNAFTSSDHTTYPFATTNHQDFHNLLSVYLDATLHPLLKEGDFLQEGWRIGPENPQSKNSETSSNSEGDQLVFKGVVYNEMKGMMSDASYLYYTRFQDLIFPAINNSGGDPQKMTDLTYSSLKDFHIQNYHPSNAKLFTYGDMPVETHAEQINHHLSAFDRRDIDRSIKAPISLTNGPSYHTVQGPIDTMLDPTMQYKTSTSWVLGDTSNVLETFSLNVISSLLLGGYGSPLYQALIESDLGPDFTSNTGFDGSSKVGVFSVGLNGVRKDVVPKVKSVLQDKLLEVYRQGFDKNKVDGILHQLELSLRHKTAEFGMSLMQRVEPGWFNGVDPFDALAWNDIGESFKQRLSEGRYLENLLEKYLLNDNTLTFTMEPSSSLSAELLREEKARLASKTSGVSTEHLVAQELALLEEQARAPEEDLSCLPTLQIKDVPRSMERKQIRDASIGSVPVQWRETSTNGLTYFRAINALSGLPTDLRMLLPLFTDSIMRLGTKTKTMGEIEDLIKLKTGGISVGYFSSPTPDDMLSSVEGLSFSGHALDSNVSEMFELLRVVLQETNFDGPEAENKVRQLLQADASGALDNVGSAGHSYARRYAEAGLTRNGLFNEQIGGLTQVQQVLELSARKQTEGLADVIEKLKAIQRFAITASSSLRAAITCGKEAAACNEAALQRCLTNLPKSSDLPHAKSSLAFNDYKSKTFFPMPYQVSYAAAALPTVSYTHADGAPLEILSQLLTHKHLHHEIREKGGAYGGGAYAKGLSGMFGFYSYRDPNLENTLKVFLDAGRFAVNKAWTDQDIQEAKLSAFQSVDAPQGVSDEGMVRFLSGVDQNMEQKKREQLLDVSKADLRGVAHKYLVDGKQNMRITALGEKKDWVQPEEWNFRNLDISKVGELIS